MATPGSTAATSRRESPTAPARPVAIAAMRSTSVGEVRPVICELLCEVDVGHDEGREHADEHDDDRPPRARTGPRRIRSRFTMPSAMPMIGVDSGAMIMAPMTVAVESASTPAVAMTPDSTSIVQKADCFARVSPERRSRSSESSSRVRRWFSGRTRSRRPMFMAPSMPLGRAAGARLPATRRASRTGRTGARRVPSRRRRSTWAALAPPARLPCCPSWRVALAGCTDDSPPSPTPSGSSTSGSTRPRPARAPPPPPRPSSATATGTASVPAGFSLDEVSLAHLPEPRRRPRRDRGRAGRPAHRLRPGGVAVPGHRSAHLPGALRRRADRPTAAATSSTCAATPSSRS